MKTFYIPTSTLNFNNILSTESLSPKSFYASRGFGMPRWTPVEENRFDEAITLYDSPHQFRRPPSDVEDHPMLVEIQTNQNFEQIQDGVYISRESIYLSPWHTRLIFFSEDHKRIALMLYESSFEAKLLHLYANKIVVKQFEGVFPPVTNREIASSPQKNEMIGRDQKINKLKGLLYGYYIGAILSSTPENICRLSILMDINNILNSVVTNPSRIASPSQRERLRDDLYKLQFNSGKLGSLMAVLNNTGLKSAIMKTFMERPQELFVFCASNDLTDKYPDADELLADLRTIEMARDNESANKNYSNALNPAISWINKNIDAAFAQIKTERKKPSLNELLISLQGINYIKYLTDVNDERIYIGCVNDLFLLPAYRGNISSCNAELADKITDKVMDILGDQWQGSKKREYLNKLRRHIAGEDFPCDWNNKVLPSMAAVLLNGDDWERLLRFMQSNGMSDYRLAFSIYGVLQGFANLLRDFTDILITFEDKDYTASVYSAFHAQLFGDSLPHLKESLSDGSRFVSKIPAEVTYQAPLAGEPLPQIRNDGPGSSPTPDQSRRPLGSVCFEASSTEQICRNNSGRPVVSHEYLSSGDVIGEAINFINSVRLKGKDKLIRVLTRIIDEMGDSTDPEKLMNLLAKNEIWAKSGNPGSAWKKLYQHFFPDCNCFQKTQRNSNIYSSDSHLLLNPETSTGTVGSLLRDTSWIDKCSGFIKGEGFKLLFKKRSQGLVYKYITPGKGYYNNPKDNKNFREHLRNSIRYYYSRQHQTLEHQFNKEELESIISYLMQNYGD